MSTPSTGPVANEQGETDAKVGVVGGTRRKVATVYFVRHGIAWHNVSPVPPPSRPENEEDDDFRHDEAGGGSELSKHGDPRWKDPPLIPDGEAQARETGRKLARLLLQTGTPPPRKLVVLASPLTRCIQTATAVVQAISETAVAARIDDPLPRLVCVEDIREAYGIHFPDCRRRRSLLEKEFPHVDFATAQITERDERWKRNARETVADVTNRVNNFLQWLAQQVETGRSGSSEEVLPPTVIVVSHGVWIECCLMLHCPHVLGYGQQRVHNCHVYKSDLIVVQHEDAKDGIKVGLQLENVSLVLPAAG